MSHGLAETVSHSSTWRYKARVTYGLECGLKKDLAQLEAQTGQLIGKVEGWSATRLEYHPAPGTWSATEAFDHLVKTEEAILEQARNSMAEPHRIGFRDRLGNLFLTKILRSDRTVKVPRSVPQVLPDKRQDLQAILERWRKTRQELQKFCAQLKPEQARLGIFKHSVAGWMTMDQVIAFFSVHMTHHEFQLARLSKALQALWSTADS